MGALLSSGQTDNHRTQLSQPAKGAQVNDYLNHGVRSGELGMVERVFAGISLTLMLGNHLAFCGHSNAHANKFKGLPKYP